MKKIILYISLLLVLILIGTNVYLLLPRLLDETLYIAVSGNMTPGYTDGEEMRNAVGLYIDKVNQKGGINGKKVKLRVFNDRNDKQKGIKIASEIAGSNDILVVLGHDWSSISIPAGKIYKKNGIPAITGSSMSDVITKENDWYFRVVSNASFQGDYIATYVYNILKYHSACIIASDSSYGAMISDSFANKARVLGIKIKNRWDFNGNSDTFDEDIAKIIFEIASIENSGIIYIAAGSYYTVKILAQLRQTGNKSPVIITDPLSANAMMFLNSLPQEKDSPGYFTDGVYAMTVFLFDIANEKASIFRKEYLKKYHKEPKWYAAFYYDAAAVACEAMKRAEIQGKGYIRRDRKEIKRAMEGMYSPDKGIKGLQGHIYFDENGDSNGPLAIGFYQNRKLLPAFSQYRFKIKTEQDDSKDSPVKKVLSGESVVVGDRMMNNTKIIYAGLDINTISHLDISKSSYRSDFYLWFRYKGEFDDIENIEFTDSIKPVNMGEPVSERKKGDITIKTYHITADFKTDLDFHNYPFDTHKLKIKFNHKNLTRDKLIYVADILGMAASQKKEIPVGISDSDAAANWHVKDKSFYENIISDVSSLGIPEYFDDRKTINYSEFCTQISIDKDQTASILKFFLPITIFILVLFSIYFISAEKLFIRLIIPISVLNANAFYHANLLYGLQVKYITFLEYYYFVIYFLVLISLLFVLIANKQYKKKGSA